MKKKLIFIGITLLALVLTTGTFAYTYSNVSTLALNATIADAVMTTYEPSAGQPPWDDILPEGEYDSEFLLPSAAGAWADLTPSDPTKQNWELVNEMPAIDSTYVYLDGKNETTDLYNLTDRLYADGYETIVSVTVHFRCAATNTAYGNAFIFTNGAYFYGNEASLSAVYNDYSQQWEINPATGQAWTWEEVDALQAGVSLRAVAKGTTSYCSQVYVAVAYEFVITQGAVPPGNLYDITPHPDYTGDMLFKIYLTNTAELLKAYQYLNIKVYAENSIEAEKTPDYQILSIETGVVLFAIEGGSDESYTVEVKGGSYRLISGEPEEWGEGWSIAPEFYLEVAQR